MDPAALRQEIEDHLHGNLLPFWRRHGPRPSGEGFIAEMANDGTVREDAPHGLILGSRLLWTFAALYRALGDERDLAVAERARRMLEDRFRDREHGGFWWRLDSDLRPVDTGKKVYGQAFCVYALSELHRATGSEDALAAAVGTWELIERHAHDAERLGYVEARAADWSTTDDLRLSVKDMNEAKSMNNHLHLLEAYTSLYRVWPEPRLAARLGELIDLFGRWIIARHGDRSHLQRFFDERWQVRSETYTYGHDIEAAWLLSEAAEALGDAGRLETADRWAVDLGRSVLAEGLTPGGGLSYQGRAGHAMPGDHDWWCQAEAVVGFWHVHQLTGEADFAEAAEQAWRFIVANFVDHQGGEWFWRVCSEGEIDHNEPKVSEWKGPYHTCRMCLEMLRRIDPEANGRKP
jgi:mannobiose 2-epimerase